MDRVAKLIIYSGHLGVFAYSKDWDCYICCFTIHKHCYRYRRIFKNLRRNITKATGMRLSDIVYCQCWFRSCRRSDESNSQVNSEYNNELDNEEYDKLETNATKTIQTHGNNDNNTINLEINYESEMRKEFEQQPIAKYENIEQNAEKETHSNAASKSNDVASNDDDDWDTISVPFRYDNQKATINYNVFNKHSKPSSGLEPPSSPTAQHCDCERDCHCHSCFCRDLCNYCCQSYDSALHNAGNGSGGSCHNTNCCDGCGDILSSCFCDCHGGGGSGDGEALIGCILGLLMILLVALLFVLPLVILGCFIVPFWLLAQGISSKLKNTLPFFFVILIFCICLIIPFTLWYLMFTLICESSLIDNSILSIFCIFWSFFHAMFNLV